jgi:hypothetical protein
MSRAIGREFDPSAGGRVLVVSGVQEGFGRESRREAGLDWRGARKLLSTRCGFLRVGREENSRIFKVLAGALAR